MMKSLWHEDTLVENMPLLSFWSAGSFVCLGGLFEASEPEGKKKKIQTREIN